ncbi:MAG TPA: M50 family metallopeptidase [Lichenihabitans sp.]|jgi:regulator of sigma E protease|nr:M50 family metallopeptidase [Lichenihabitans sp.]
MSLFAHVGSLLGTLIPFLFVLTIVVFFHEMGHFLVGRWCGVKVDAFSLGFGPELFARTDRKGTRWRIAAVPLGGYVKFHGDINAASAQSEALVSELPPEERKVTFAAQPVASRAAIVAAGPIANFLLAIVILTATFYIDGKPVLTPRIENVVAGSAADRAGFMPGDLIVAIDSTPIDSFSDMQRIVGASGDVPLTFKVQRGSSEVALNATPERKDVVGPFGTTRLGVLGVGTSSKPGDFRTDRLTLPQSVATAAGEIWFVVDRTGSYVGGLFMGRESAAQLSGPIRIAEVSGAVAKLGIGALLNWAAFLSISIGLINLVPVPLLDGGHLLYFAFEAIRGRPLSERAQEFGFKVGLAFVSLLMIFATYNDLARPMHP